MFELTKEEFENWRSQFVTSNRDKMGLRYKPMAFTEQGVAMLSSVLRSERAIEVNMAIMRAAFVQLREMLASNVELASNSDYGNFAFERALRKKDLKHFPVLFKFDDNFKFSRLTILR